MMTMHVYDEYEERIKHEIQSYLDGVNKKLKYSSGKRFQSFTLEYMDCDDYKQRRITIKIAVDPKFSCVHSSLQIDFTFGEDEDQYWSGFSYIPESEEKHFQETLLNKQILSWDLLQYLIVFFTKMQNKD